MTVDEVCERYSDNIQVRRKSVSIRIKETGLYPTFGIKTVDDLKCLKYWTTPEVINTGFIIFGCDIEDAKADDWELVE